MGHQDKSGGVSLTNAQESSHSSRARFRPIFWANILDVFQSKVRQANHIIICTIVMYYILSDPKGLCMIQTIIGFSSCH